MVFFFNFVTLIRLRVIFEDFVFLRRYLGWFFDILYLFFFGFIVEVLMFFLWYQVPAWQCGSPRQVRRIQDKCDDATISAHPRIRDNSSNIVTMLLRMGGQRRPTPILTLISTLPHTNIHKKYPKRILAKWVYDKL